MNRVELELVPRVNTEVCCPLGPDLTDWNEELFFNTSPITILFFEDDGLTVSTLVVFRLSCPGRK